MAEDVKEEVEIEERHMLRPATPPPPPEGQFTLIHLMLLVAACALLFSLVTFTGFVPFLVFTGLIVVPAIVVGVVATLVVRHSTQQDALLWVMAIALEKRLPLAPGIQAMADQFGPLFRARILAFADWLNQGMPLPEALARVPGILPRPVRVLVRVGWETGTLPAAMREGANLRLFRPGNRHPLLWKLAYLVGMLLDIQVMCGFMMYFILPKFEAIARDFGSALPPLTIALIELSHILTNKHILPLLFLFELAFLVYIPFHYFGWFQLRLPLADRVLRKRHTGLILRALAVVVERGQPLEGALRTLARYYPVRWVRKRMARVLWGMEQGASTWECLRWQRVLTRPEVAVLNSAERAGNLGWALRELADSGERRMLYQLQVFSQFLFIAIVIGLGGIVFLVSVAYFAPLISIISTIGGF